MPILRNGKYLVKPIDDTSLKTHTDDKNNPHNVTRNQINASDAIHTHNLTSLVNLSLGLDFMNPVNISSGQTAPISGFLVANGAGSAYTYGYVAINNKTVATITSASTNETAQHTCCVPIKKGDLYTCVYYSGARIYPIQT